MATIEYEIQQGVAVLTIDNPPVNAMSMAVRNGIIEAVERLNKDPEVEAAVLIGKNNVFIPGADISEFGKNLPGPSGREVIASMASSRKPIIAALGKHALGGGLEIALGAHFRVATPDCKLGFPEVNIGLLPGAGGTQRLPRLIGAQKALDLLLSGKPVDARTGSQMGLVDELVEGELLPGAIAFAKQVIAEKRPTVPAGESQEQVSDTDPSIFADVRKKNERKWRGLIAPQRIVELVEAACRMPFPESYALELEYFNECKASSQRAALIYAFNAEREAAKIPGLPADVQAKTIQSAAVIGAGTMGGGIAMSFANAGIPVKLVDTTEEALARGRDLIEKNYATSVSRGSISQEQADQRLSLITGVVDYADLAECDIVIEAVFEDMDIKQEVFRKLDAVMKPGAVLATNTSTLDIDKIAEVLKRPEDFIGTHFFSPANVMKLLEGVRAAKSSPETIATVMKLAKQLGKVAVLAGNCDGFIGNRVLAVYGRECDFMLEEGATPWQIDNALKGFGFPMGLYLMRDMSGLDVGWRIRQYREQFRPKHLRYSPIADRICEMGRFGQKTSAGYYKYEGREGTPDPVIEQLIEQVSADLGIQRRTFTDEEIVARVLSAMANEGAKIVGEGVAIRASDIDVTFLNGYGFPRYQGGPMYWAQQYGLDKVMSIVNSYHESQGELWTPAPLLEKLVSTGGKSWTEAS